MTDWAAFVGVTGVVLFALLLLARASSSVVTTSSSRPGGGRNVEPRWTFEQKYFDTTDGQRRERERIGEHVAEHDRPADATDCDPTSDHGPLDVDTPPTGTDVGTSRSESGVTAGDRATGDRSTDDPERDPITGVPLGGSGTDHGSSHHISPSLLLLNVALSQGLFGLVLVGAVVYTSVPLDALGVDVTSGLSAGLPAVGVGIALGLGLYAANALGAVGAASLGLDHDETLRELLTPESTVGWVVLLGGVLPIIAGFEELLFRAALVGVPAAGFGLSPWLLAVGSSVAFALGHGAQGRLGVLMTGLLGFVLAVAFVLTDSLLVVVVAHYLVNALEFVVGGYFGVEWGG